MFEFGSGRQMAKLRVLLRHVRVSFHFDSKFYLSRYPDVAASGIHPLLHYLRYGAKELRNPNAGFSAKFYLENNPDVHSSGIDPFVHFVLWGRAEGRAGVPPGTAPCEAPLKPGIQTVDEFDERIETIQNDFDPDFYLSRYADVEMLNVDPLRHYLEQGAAELRDPSREFSTAYYLESNPDVASSGMNPFLHFLVEGRREGRLPQPPGGFRAQHLREIVPLSETVRRWRSARKSIEICDVAELREKLFGIFGVGSRQAVISIGHDDYRAHTGGVQLCIEIEENAFRDLGTVYVNLHPAEPLPVLADATERYRQLVVMIVDGERVGVARAEDIVEVVAELAARDVSFSTTVHALHGHTTEFVRDIVFASRSSDSLYWLHDYFSICPGYTLLRNDVSFCGAPRVESQACAVCVYGEARAEHVARMQKLFEDVSFKVVAPSALALDVWRSGSALRCQSEIVSAHCRLEMRKTADDEINIVDNAPVRVAFLGIPTMRKGWNFFEKLVREIRADSEAGSSFEFYYFGNECLNSGDITEIPVDVSMQNIHAMVAAVTAARIDFVVLWSLWPETFSFTAHESLAAGAYILTGPDSGNIARLASGAGRVFESENALLSFLRSGDAQRLAAERREKIMTGDLVFGRMSADILQRQYEVG
ncbi:hypothetical protein [Parvibaculum sp.]|jgi:hypothetical protein|uniref:hypothetical protein n=1 Tax=Parvibaculum sp. TaxID=2024848 RepID=UPI002FDB5A56